MPFMQGSVEGNMARVRTNELLELLLVEQRKTNIHQKKMSGLEIDSQDVEPLDI